MSRRFVQAAISAVLSVAAAALIMLATALPASAHVRVSSSDAVPGGYGMITFRVPTESATASTTAVIIDLPADTPLASVSVLRVEGWTATTTTKKLDRPVHTDDGDIDSYVSRIVWKADSARTAIKPGEFGLFSITAGPLPRRDAIVLPTTQRYSDGSSVAWDQVAADPGAEPEHPAPTLQLNATGPSADATAGSPTVSADPGRSSVPGSATSAGSPVLPVVAVALGVVAVIMSAIALLRSRRG